MAWFSLGAAATTPLPASSHRAGLCLAGGSAALLEAQPPPRAPPPAPAPAPPFGSHTSHHLRLCKMTCSLGRRSIPRSGMFTPGGNDTLQSKHRRLTYRRLCVSSHTGRLSGGCLVHCAATRTLAPRATRGSLKPTTHTPHSNWRATIKTYHHCIKLTCSVK